MILLAIQIGYPDIAVHLFEEIDAALSKDDAQSIGDVIGHLKHEAPEGTDPKKWTAAIESFQSVNDLYGEPADMTNLQISVLDDWLLGTSRFGFQEWVPRAKRLW